MERRGDWSINSDHTTNSQSADVPEAQKVITKLETQVEEQKRLRLQEAKQVEAKAALIKEWVANKLRGLEEQNQQLREQNDRCNQQIELLRNHLEQLRHMKPGVRTSLSLDVEKEEIQPLNNICNRWVLYYFKQLPKKRLFNFVIVWESQFWAPRVLLFPRGTPGMYFIFGHESITKLHV